MKAIYNGTVIAESENTVVVEGNHYFPPQGIKKEYFKESSTHTVCPWKGVAHYYTLSVNDQEDKDGAWYYPDTSELAKNIKDYVAFGKNVNIEG